MQLASETQAAAENICHYDCITSSSFFFLHNFQKSYSQYDNLGSDRFLHSKFIYILKPSEPYKQDGT